MNLKPLFNPIKKYKLIRPGVIEGYWNEDLNPFLIRCPIQLQDLLLYVLNNLEVNKIVISKSPTADTRSAKEKVSKSQLLSSSKQHIQDVQKAVNFIISKLRDISEKHDYTKIENLDEFYNNFKFLQDNNVGDFKQMNWYKNYHLKERHHLPDRCPNDVNLFDVLERIVDIVTAGMARNGKLYEDKLSPEILIKAYQNTLELLKKHTEVKD